MTLYVDSLVNECHFGNCDIVIWVYFFPGEHAPKCDQYAEAEHPEGVSSAKIESSPVTQNTLMKRMK